MTTTTITPDIKLVPDSFEYVGPDRVRVTLKTADGAMVSYVLTIAALAQSINMATAVFNSSPAQVLRDLGVF